LGGVERKNFVSERGKRGEEWKRRKVDRSGRRGVEGLGGGVGTREGEDLNNKTRKEMPSDQNSKKKVKKMSSKKF